MRDRLSARMAFAPYAHELCRYPLCDVGLWLARRGGSFFEALIDDVAHDVANAQLRRLEDRFGAKHEVIGDVLIDFQCVVVWAFGWRQFDERRHKAVFPCQFANAVQEVRFAAAEIPLHELKTRSLLEQRLEIFVFQDVEIALVADVDSTQTELGRLTAFAQSLDDMRCDEFVLFVCSHVAPSMFCTDKCSRVAPAPLR